MVANEWKDANDKVMPVKQWLEERRFLQVNTVLFYILFLEQHLWPSFDNTSMVWLSPLCVINSYFVGRNAATQGQASHN